MTKWIWKLSQRLAQIFGITPKSLRELEEKERRDFEGFTAWHPDYGQVYYPPRRVPPNEYSA